MLHNTKTVAMMEHLAKELSRKDVFIRVPEGVTPAPEWKSITKDNMRVLYQKEHKFSTEWEVIVHGVFKFGVVLRNNKYGYHIQQLLYKP